MTSFAKCHGHGCPKKSTCYRYTAKASEWQEWAGFWTDEKAGRGKCEYYWPNEAELKRIDENVPAKSREA